MSPSASTTQPRWCAYQVTNNLSCSHPTSPELVFIVLLAMRSGCSTSCKQLLDGAGLLAALYELDSASGHVRSVYLQVTRGTEPAQPAAGASTDCKDGDVLPQGSSGAASTSMHIGDLTSGHEVPYLLNL